MQTKREKVIIALKNEDYIEALKIAKNFVRDFNKEERSIIKRAYEMQWNPAFYEALGFNKEVECNKAVNILKQKYLN